MADQQERKENSLVPTVTRAEGQSLSQDAVFGELTEDGPNYRNVGWLGTSVIMLKVQIGLGVMSMPSAFDALGIVPGIICLCVITGITTWSNYMVGDFKLRHPEVYGIDDIGGLLFGKTGRIVLGTAFVLCKVILSLIIA
ncbi:hypothetical protein N7478_005548 [Penicillium angulare]|uniref:uncharacterized protein n=1 Tax=Penicillium angulare TaxID=116970 RepID=UPI002541164E|nr:uncharacterized protein N7478_005548 [Penicillium angulare]KAJ5280176.1 hypothetical protein N7478_005548 [Penicillium angulare]